MVIDCGPNRRIVWYRWGWRIDRRIETKDGSIKWTEDAPAYPSNLAQAFENVAERILAESDDATPAELPALLLRLEVRLQRYFDQARELGTKLEEELKR